MDVYKASSIGGEIKIPGDKSISHRSAIISALSEEEVIIKNFLKSRDCINTLDILKKIGVKITENENGISVLGRGIRCLKEPSGILDVGNSGTTIRIMSGVLAGTDFVSVLSGDSSINNRPMDRIIAPLREMGANIYGRSNNSKAPLIIFGNPNLKSRVHSLNVASAQVKSCLLMAALSADGQTEIYQPQISRDHTERMLEFFGADIKYDGKNTVIKSGKSLRARELFIPGDLSSAAFFIIAAIILKDSHLVIRKTGINPTRSCIIEVLKKMGAKIILRNKRTVNKEPMADIEIFSSNLKSVNIEEDKIPNIIDEIPILCVAAALAEGTTVIKGAGELRHKESDRINSIVSQYSKLGVNIMECNDSIIIKGNSKLKANSTGTDSFGDHRIAMSLAILGLISKEKISIKNTECINTSFPGFGEILKNSTG